MIGFFSAGRFFNQARTDSVGVFTFMLRIYHTEARRRYTLATTHELRNEMVRNSWVIGKNHHASEQPGSIAVGNTPLVLLYYCLYRTRTDLLECLL